ncbi:MAG: MoxR family ATPase [Gemmatimonadota bacterium]
MSDWRVYRAAVPAPPTPGKTEDPGAYLPDPGLVDAVNVAIALGQPLLLTGEPGTGKTQLAYSVSNQLFGTPPIVFNTKTTSTARDLFYQYDALRHFRDSQLRDGTQAPLRPSDYISFEALGLAILVAMDRDQVAAALPMEYRSRGRGRSVVLIDEIDKAPRDLPNDVLAEIEQMRFEVKETGHQFAAEPEYRPIVVLTSNSEKLLPDAFLRRCVYYHLPFPNRDQLVKIVKARLGDDRVRPPWVLKVIEEFERIRTKPLKKKPATAELLAWLRVLERLAEDGRGDDPTTHPSYTATLAAIVKNKDDFDAVAGPR